MRFRFDHFNRIDPPKMALCNPGAVYTEYEPLSRVIGFLSHTTDEEIAYNFNDVSVLSFRANQSLSIADTDLCLDNISIPYCVVPMVEVGKQEQLYNDILSHRLIFVDDVGFFVVTDVTESCDENGLYYKDVKAESIEAELRDKTVPYIADGTYPLLDTEIGGEEETSVASDNEVVDGILNIIIGRFPLWSIGFVDNAVKSRWRTFKDIDISSDCLAFLKSEVQKAYDCFIEFDPIYRTVNVYDRATYPDRNHTSIYIDTDGIINNLQIREDIGSSCTALHVTGSDGLSIANVNPLGGSIIYNFSHYMDWFSLSLRNAVSSWMNAITAAQPRYINNCLLYDKYKRHATFMELSIQRLEIIVGVYQQLYDNIYNEINSQSPNTDLVKELFDEVNDYIEENGDGEPIDPDTSIQDALDSLNDIIAGYNWDISFYQAALASDNTEIATLDSAISSTIENLALDVYFTTDQYNELRYYIFEQDYVDEYITVTDMMTLEEEQDQRKALYDVGVAELANRVTPAQEFTINLNDLLMTQREYPNGAISYDANYEHIISQLHIGALVNVDVTPPKQSLIRGTRYAELAVVSIVVNYDDFSLSFTVGSKYNRANPKALFEEVFKS